MTESLHNPTNARRTWPLAAAAIVVVVLAAVALSDLRRAPVTPDSAGSGVANAPLAGAPVAAQPAQDDEARRLERARRNAMRNVEARVNPQQPTPLMNAWSDALAGKPTASEPEADNAAQQDAPRIAPRLRHLAARVNLTPEQLDTLATALNDERTQVAALRQQGQDGTLTHEQVRAQIDALRDRTDAQVAPVLDADQRAAFSELRDRDARRSAR
jgi:hypothetical protein